MKFFPPVKFIVYKLIKLGLLIIVLTFKSNTLGDLIEDKSTVENIKDTNTNQSHFLVKVEVMIMQVMLTF